MPKNPLQFYSKWSIQSIWEINLNVIVQSNNEYLLIEVRLFSVKGEPALHHIEGLSSKKWTLLYEKSWFFILIIYY